MATYAARKLYVFDGFTNMLELLLSPFAKPQRLSLGLRRCVRSMREHLALALFHDGAKVALG